MCEENIGKRNEIKDSIFDVNTTNNLLAIRNRTKTIKWKDKNKLKHLIEDIFFQINKYQNITHTNTHYISTPLPPPLSVLAKDVSAVA